MKIRPSLLVVESVCYLALPYVIFFIGWLEWYFAVLGIGLMALPLLYGARHRSQPAEHEAGCSDSLVLGWRHVLLVLAVSLALLGVSGVGGYGYQDTDWFKHNGVLQDLVERPWPVSYSIAGQEMPLVYYLAYYLPAALLGKIGGWILANQVLWVWTWIGLVLAMVWFLVLVRRAGWTVLLFFVLFSGLDVIGEWLVTPTVVAIRPEYAAAVNWEHIERWAIGWEYSSNTTLLFWVPHQALVGWIATGMVMYTILRSARKSHLLFYLGLTALWSPFVTAGLLPYLVADIVLQPGTFERIKRYVTVPNFSGLGMLAVAGLYLTSKWYPMSPALSGEIPHGFILSALNDTQAQVIAVIVMVLFCLFEFGLYGIFLYRSRPSWDTTTKSLFATTLLCLSLIPLYRVGGENDFAMRASIPALFVLAVLLARTLHEQSWTKATQIVLIMLVAVGSFTALVEIRRHVTNIVDAGVLVKTPRDDWTLGLGSQLSYYQQRNLNSLVLQYVGSPRAPFFTLLSRGSVGRGE